MLLELKKFADQMDARYASDEELKLFETLSSCAPSRIALYSKLAQAEEQILAVLYRQLETTHPQVFVINQRDVSLQCKQEVQYTFRQAVYSILLGEEWLMENFLSWMQTIVRSLKLQQPCGVVYQTLERLLQVNLPLAESQIICPIIRTIRESLTQK